MLEVVPCNALHDVVKRLDTSIQRFWSERKAGRCKLRRARPGKPFKRWPENLTFWPRWRRLAEADSIGMQWQRGAIGDRIEIKSFSARVRWDRPLPLGSRPKHVVIQRDGSRYYLTVQCEVPDEALARPAAEVAAVGVDVGINKIMALSDGSVVPNPRFRDDTARERRVIQRKMSRRTKGSLAWKAARAELRKLDSRVQRARIDYAHVVSRWLASHYRTIGIESRRALSGLLRGKLAGQVADAQWGRIIQMLKYKLVEHGGELREVPAAGTSQVCSECGVVVPKPLSERRHRCPDCGLDIDRDENAARNILRLALGEQFASGSVTNRSAHGPGRANVPSSQSDALRQKPNRPRRSQTSPQVPRKTRRTRARVAAPEGTVG
jgi:putative transposase